MLLKYAVLVYTLEDLKRRQVRHNQSCVNYG